MRQTNSNSAPPKNLASVMKATHIRTKSIISVTDYIITVCDYIITDDDLIITDVDYRNITKKQNF